MTSLNFTFIRWRLQKTKRRQGGSEVPKVSPPKWSQIHPSVTASRRQAVERPGDLYERSEALT